MKQSAIRFLLLALLLAVKTNMFAEKVMYDGILFELSNNQTASVISRTNFFNDYFNGQKYMGDVVIPSEIKEKGKTYTVTSIGNGAFGECDRLTSVTIPNSVTSIGNSAFSGCNSISSINIPNSVTSIGNSAFSSCHLLYSLTIPNSVTTIGAFAFSYCHKLSSITIPNSVTSIGRGAFFGCGSLSSIIIPNSVTSIGGGAFAGCGSLTSVTVSNNIDSISKETFKDCSKLITVNIPDRVISIGSSAFANCSSLSIVTIPNNVTSIGSSAFSYCNNLTSVNIPSNVTTIGSGAFQGCNKITSIIIPNSVTDIGSWAFQRCSSLTSITIGGGVKSIGNMAFYLSDAIEKVTLLCSNVESWFSGKSTLKKVILGDNVISIGNGAFMGCSGLSSIIIPNSVTSIGNRAFERCSSLTSVTIPNSVTSIGDDAFWQCSLTSVDIPNNVTSVGSNAFLCRSLVSVKIGKGVTYIGNGAFGSWVEHLVIQCPVVMKWFDRCKSLKEIVFDEGVTSIEKDIFTYCDSLLSVTIGNSVTSIGDGAFQNCRKLSSLTIGNSMKSIGNWAFSGCNNLSSITIPSSVTYIGNRAFPYDTFMVLLGDTPPELSYEESWGVYHKIEVPKGSACRYAIAENWEKVDTIFSKDGNTILYPVAIMNNKHIIAVNGNLNGTEVAEGAEVEVTNANNQYLPYSMIMRDNCEITNTIMRDGKYVFKASSNHKANAITTYSYPHKDIQLSESGTLIDIIGIDNLDKMECLKVRGNINGTDILTIRKMKNLKLLDLSDAHVVNGGMSYYENYKSSENIIGEHFYDGLKRVLRIKLPLDIEAIKHDAFSGCDSCIVIYVPKTVKDYATSLTVPLYNLRSIQLEDLSAWCNMKPRFYITWHVHNYHLVLNDREITDLVIPENIHELNRYAFKGCAWIKSLTLPSAVTSIEEWAFYGCKSLTSVTSFNPTPPEIAKEIFEKDAYENSTLYVPKGSKTLYWLHPYWEKFKNIVELGDTGINDVTVDQHQQREGVYTIDGVKLSSNAGNTDNLPKGIYIINGQKVVIK